MAKYDNNAFDAMIDSNGQDNYISGGAIFVSEYENNMKPDDQKKFEQTLMERFQMAYDRDPYKQNLDFKHWLQGLKPELYRERAQKYDDIRAENNGMYKLQNMDPLKAALLEDAGLIQDLAHLHTGRIEDIITIVDSNATHAASPQAGMGAAPMGAAPQDTSVQGLFNYEGTNEELSKELGLDPGSIPRNPAQGG